MQYHHLHTNTWYKNKLVQQTDCFENLVLNYIIFGCSLNTDAMQFLNFCMLYTKYYIYIQRLFNKNELDIYACLAQVKLTLEIEYTICKNSNKEKDVQKF